MIPSAIFRLRARTALQGKWSVAILVGLAASMPSLIAQVTSLLGGSALTTLMNGLTTLMAQGAPTEAQLTALMAQVQITPGDWLSLLSAVVGPVLTLGLIHYLLITVRGGVDAPFTTVFSRVKCFFRSVGLAIVTELLVLLWMLPGLAVMLLPLLLATVWPQMPVLLVELLLTAGMIVSMVLGLRASMHYAMANFVLADEPAARVMDCIRGSLGIMRTRKLAWFVLRMSFWGYWLLIALVEMLALSMFGQVVANTLSMAGQLLLNIYVVASLCVFYDAHRPRKEIV